MKQSDPTHDSTDVRRVHKPSVKTSATVTFYVMRTSLLSPQRKAATPTPTPH